jgi:hypothetical protein
MTTERVDFSSFDDPVLGSISDRVRVFGDGQNVIRLLVVSQCGSDQPAAGAGARGLKNDTRSLFD